MSATVPGNCELDLVNAGILPPLEVGLNVLKLRPYEAYQWLYTKEFVAPAVAVKAGEKDGKPCYYFVVMGNFPLHYKEPSYEEQIAQSWGCICSGVTGISWFYGTPVTPGNWKAMCEVAKETGDLEEILLSEEIVEQACSSSGRADLRTITRKLGDTVLVAACNIVETPLEKVTFMLPSSLPQSGTVEVLYENRTLPLEDGVLTDDFAGHTRHLYRITVRPWWKIW